MEDMAQGVQAVAHAATIVQNNSMIEQEVPGKGGANAVQQMDDI